MVFYPNYNLRSWPLKGHVCYLQDLVEIDNEIRESVSAFVENGGKIPSKVHQSSLFNKPYFESHFLPRYFYNNIFLYFFFSSDKIENRKSCLCS
jgi:hypothetical protein